MPAASTQYPKFLDRISDFVEQHRSKKTEKLRLAVYFAPPGRAKRDIYLFEVADGFGNNEPDPKRRLFEFAYGSTPALPLPDGSQLQMILTSPTELQRAVKENWKGIEKIRAARAEDKATIVYADSKGRKLWGLLK